MSQSSNRETGHVSSRRKKKRKKQIDWVSIFFLLIFIYLGVHIYRYASKERFPLYEVPQAESVTQNQRFQGFILRSEVCYTAPQDGYINYYVAAGRRTAAGATVYTLDKEGEFSEMLLSSSGDGQNLSEADLKKIVQRMKNLQQDFNGMDFQDVYNAKNAISAVVMDSLTAAAIEVLNETMGISGFTRILADRSGIVSLTSDCYDGWTEEQLNLKCLTGDEYSRNVSMAGDNRKTGDFVYKIVTDEAFQVYFEMDSNKILEYGSDLSTTHSVPVTVYLSKIKQTAAADLMLVQMSDGETACRLSFSKYGSNYINDRYIEFEIVEENVCGMKIPASAVVQKDFLMVSPEFVTKGADGSGLGVLKQTASGEPVFVPFDLYSLETEWVNEENEEEPVEKIIWYYVRTDDLSIGDILVKTDSQETYTIISAVPVTGVYEANQGYTEFKIVTILHTTEDSAYYLVKPRVRYGIAAFDYIVIDASKVEEGQVLE